MYSFLASPATRAVPLDWTRLVLSALAVVNVKASEEVLNVLAMLHSYAAASPSVFTNLTRGSRDVKEYVALLTALDDTVSAWPLRLRQLLALPPVALVSTGAGGNGSLVSVPVRTPRGEALAFLLNVAIDHVENGLTYLARVWADTAAAASVNTPQGGSVAAPNQNAKTAALHFKQGVEVLRWADALHATPASPSACALQQLHAQLPLDTTLGLAQLAATTAKYMYALSSASTKGKPDVLAQLAFDAAQLPLPPSVPPTSSLQLLPSLLLSAYHFHKATWYYGHASTSGPEMAEALGHARYADALLRGCDARWGAEEGQQQAEQESRQWWGRRLTSLFTGGGAGKKNRQGAAASAEARSLRAARTTAEGGDGDSDDAETPIRPATQYPRLHALLFTPTSPTSTAGGADMIGAATPDVVQVYPYLRLLLHDVCAARHQYEKENRVVYFAKVASDDEVRRDVPDTAAHTTRGDASSVSESAIFDSRASLFASLPSAAALQTALAQQEEVGQTQQALARALQRLERDGRRLFSYVTPPAALDSALDALEALLPAEQHWASPEAAVALAADAIDVAGNAFKTVSAAWQEAHDDYIGEQCPPHTTVETTMAEIAVWTERTTAALGAWAALRVPQTVASRADFVSSLVPRSAEMLAFVEQVEALSRDVRDVLAAEPGTVTQEQVHSVVDAVEKVHLTGVELVAVAAAAATTASSTATTTATPGRAARTFTRDGDSAEELPVSPQYAAAEAAVWAVVAVLTEAPMVVAHVEDSTAVLTDMQEKAVMVPLVRLHDVHFNPTAAGGMRSVIGSGITAGAKKPSARKGGNSAAPAAPSSVSVTSSRKRTRSPTPSPSSDSESCGDASVASSQLGEAQEVAPTASDGVTRAKVSAGLLRRMQANKAKRQHEAASASGAAKKVSKTQETRPRR